MRFPERPVADMARGALFFLTARMNWKLTADLLVIGAYFVAILGIGVYFSRKSGDVSEFTLGGRSIPWWAVLASILASEISAGTFFGTPGEGFHLRNFTYAQLLVGYIFARFVVSGVFIPAFYRHNVVSIYEFLETRFGPRTRRVASAVFLLTRALASGSRLWVPTVLIVILWNLANPGQQLGAWDQFWLSGAALVVVSLLTAMYTAIGGIKAVIWTDVIQIGVLFGALGFSLWYLLGHIPGGWEGAKAYLTQPGDLQFLRVNGDSVEKAMAAAKEAGGAVPEFTFWERCRSVLESEYTIWAALFGSMFTTMATHGTDQDMVQRMLTAKNKRESARATILSGLADFPVVFAVLAIGILLSVYYQNVVTDPLLPRNAKGEPESSQIFPHFVLTVMPGGLRGLVVAGVLATTMGSLGTALNSLATSYCRDFHFRWFGTSEDEGARVTVIRKATVAFALVLIGIGLGTAYVKAHNPGLRIIPIILGSFGYTYGSLLGIFMVGLFTKTRGNERGNLMAMAAGFVVVAVLSDLHTGLVRLVWAGCPDLRPAWLPVVEFPWRILFGTVVTFGVAVCFRTPEEQMRRMAAV